MIKNITLFILLLVTVQLTAQDNKAFPLKFAFSHSDTLRAAQPVGGIVNTNAIVYNPVSNELWMSSSHNDSMMRFSVPAGKYLGAVRVAKLIAPLTNTTRYFRALAVDNNNFIWGVNSTDTIRKLDPTTAQEVSRIVVPKWMGNQSIIAYDSTNNGGFWLYGTTGMLRRVDTTFQILTDSILIDASFKVGGLTQVAFDATSVGGPYLWLYGGRHPEFTNPSTGSPALTTVTQVSLATKLRTGVQKSITDDFDFILNTNQSPRGFTITKLPNFPNPIMIMSVGKFSGSTLLNTDLSGITAGYELGNMIRPDGSVDSLAITPNYSIVPIPWYKPISISAKMRNVVAFQTTSGNVNLQTTNASGTLINTQSVPFNTNPTAAYFVTAANTVSGLTKGVNKIRATVQVTNDPVVQNDTLSAYVQLSDSTLARDYADFLPNVYVKTSQFSKTLGLQRSNLIPERPELGQAYKLDVPVTLTSVTARVGIRVSGDTTRFKVYSINASGKPQYLGQSALYQITPTDSANYTITLPLLEPIRIAGGQEFMVSMTEGFNGPNIMGTVQGYEKGKTFIQALVTFGGWATTDTLSQGLQSTYARALAIRPNFQLRTDVKEASNIATLSLTPNPTNGLVQLNMALDNTDDVSVRVYNLNGQLISNQHFNAIKSINQNLDLSAQANGIYVISLTTSKGTLTRKVVKE